MKGKASKGKKGKKSSVPVPLPPSGVDELLSRHRVEVPSTLSGWKARRDLLHLDLHLLHAPYLQLTFLLSTSSPLSSLLHRLHAVHGPFSGLRLFRCSDESEDDELTDLSLTLDELGCQGGGAGGAGVAEEADGGSGSAARRYELWYTLLSSLDGALLMREPRQYISEEQIHEAMLDDEQQDDEDEPLSAPSIVVTADDSSAHSTPQQHLSSGRLQAALGRVTAGAKMGRVVEVAVDQHTSRQRVEQSKELIEEAFEVGAQSGQQLRPPPPPRHSSSDATVEVGSDMTAKEGQEQQRNAVSEAALSLALTYS